MYPSALASEGERAGGLTAGFACDVADGGACAQSRADKKINPKHAAHFLIRSSSQIVTKGHALKQRGNRTVYFAMSENEVILAAHWRRKKFMKPAPAKKTRIKIAVVESDPLRFVGFRALFDSETDLELTAASLPELAANGAVDLVLLGSRNGQNLFDAMAGLKASRPDLRIIVTGSGADDETILKALAAGAKGYVDEAATPVEFVQAIRMVNQGSVWAPRRVLSIFIERVTSAPGRIFPAGRVTFTDREKEVLELLVAGRSNKEIGGSLGIEERTVKAHVAKLMRKVGVQNRIALSVHAITHSLVAAKY
jgi:DNA-binding NarL/FixJ family response regulator